MALSPDADVLTDDYRRRQAQVGAYMLGQLGQLWPKLDPRDLDKTREPWLRAVTALVAQGYTASATLAAAYLPAFRSLERIPGQAPTVPLSVPDLDRIIAAQAYLGPIRHLERLRGGADFDESWRIARNQTLAAGQQGTLDGGRDQTVTTVHHDTQALGWARVCSASACAFCQMLTARGPVYKAQRTAHFQAHPGCNCTVEPAYHAGADAWAPRARVLSQEFGEVTKGLSSDEARLAWRRHLEGRAARTPAPATGGARGVDATQTASGRGRVLGRAGSAVDSTGKRKAGAAAPASRADQATAQLRALRVSLARLEARQAAGEEVGTALKWQRDRIAALEAELGPDVAATVTADTAQAAAAGEQAAALNAGQAAARAAAERQVADKARVAAERQAAQDLADAEQARTIEATAVRAAEQARAAEAVKAADGAELDDQGHPWRLTSAYLDEAEAAGDLDALVDYCAEGLADDNPLELARWQDLEVLLDYRERYASIVAQAGEVADDVVSRELLELMETHGRLGVTHTADELEALGGHVRTQAGRPSRRDVQEDYALYVEDLYVRGQDATRGHLLNAKGDAALAAGKLTGRDLFQGDVRRVYRYASPELLEFFEANRRVQWSTFYAERTGSDAFASLAARQRRLNEGIDRDRNALDLVTNREA